MTFSVETTVDDLTRRCDGLVMDIARYVFFATNWPAGAESVEKLREQVKAGYAFNLWPEPAALRE